MEAQRPDGSEWLVTILFGYAGNDEELIAELSTLRHPVLAPVRAIRSPRGGLALVAPPPGRSLRDRFQELSRTDPHSNLVKPLYLIAEKILEPGERLPDEWPVHGTTGYDFLNSLNGLFVDRTNARAFDRVYSRFIHHQLDFQELVYLCKKLIMQASMSSEVSVLGYQLDRISERNRWSRDFTLSGLTEAIVEIIA